MLHMSGGQIYLLIAKDMAKVCGLPSVVKVCTSMLCVKIGHRKVVGPLAVVNVVTQIGTSQVHIVHSLLL